MIYYETILSFQRSKNISNLLTIHARTRGINFIYSSKFFSLINLFEYSLPISSIRSLHAFVFRARSIGARREELLEDGLGQK